MTLVSFRFLVNYLCLHVHCQREDDPFTEQSVTASQFQSKRTPFQDKNEARAEINVTLYAFVCIFFWITRERTSHTSLPSAAPIDEILRFQ